MTRRRRRMAMVLACGVGLGTAAALSLSAFSDSMVFFLAPSDVAAKAAPGRMFRLGGLVEAGSVRREVVDGRPTAAFRVTDGRSSVEVSYSGILPDLFREGQGVVALGTVTADRNFRAQEVLAKHDETYMPKEVVEALKKSGQWNPATGAPPPASTWNTMSVPAQADATPARAGG